MIVERMPAFPALPTLLVVVGVWASSACSSPTATSGIQNTTNPTDAAASETGPAAEAATEGGTMDAGTTTRTDAGSVAPIDASSADAGPDLDMQASDFDCILKWTKVGDFRITNKLGDPSGSIAVASSPSGGTYPVGTLIQLIPNEAMVKRRVGFNPANNDWEFFSLSTSASGTTIVQRGGAEVKNAFGGSCANCHGMAQSQFDFVCGTTHGCTPLPINEATIQSIQDGDPRCGDWGQGSGLRLQSNHGNGVHRPGRARSLSLKPEA